MAHQIIDVITPYVAVPGAANPELLAAVRETSRDALAQVPGLAASAGSAAGAAAGATAAVQALASDPGIAQAAVDAVTAATLGMDTVVVTNQGSTSSTAQWAHPTTDWVQDTVSDSVGAATSITVAGSATWPQLTGGKLDAEVLPPDPTLSGRMDVMDGRVSTVETDVETLGSQIAGLGIVWSTPTPVPLASGLMGSLLVSESPSRIRIVGTVTGSISAGAPLLASGGPKVQAFLPWIAGQSTQGVRTTVGNLVAIASGSSLTVDVTLQKPTLPVVYVFLDDPAAVINNTNYVRATVRVDHDGTGTVVEEFTTDFRGHGNSTWLGTKKPYRFKTDAEQKLLGMKSGKHWRLLANWYDPLRLRPSVFYDVGHDRANDIGWTPHGHWAELVIVRGTVGQYMGLYDVRESVRIDSNRLDIDELAGSETDPLEITGGWLLEADNKEAATVPGFTSTGIPSFFAYDTPEEPNAAQQAYIAAYMGQVASEILDGDLTHIHLPSWIAWYWANELVTNEDSRFTSSCKLWKPRATLAEDAATIVESQLHMGPLWDADLSIGVAWPPGGAQSWVQPASGWWTRNGPWMSNLFAVPAFKSAAKDMWGEISASIDTIVIPRLEDHAARTRAALAEDHRIYNQVDDTEGQLRRAIIWLRARTSWINTNI